MTTAYSRIDRFLRQNLNDKDYPAYKEELDALCQAKAQRTWVELTDEEMIECERLADIRHRKHMGSIRGQQLSPADQFLWHYARAIEAKLKQKNGFAEENT